MDNYHKLLSLCLCFLLACLHYCSFTVRADCPAEGATSSSCRSTTTDNDGESAATLTSTFTRGQATRHRRAAPATEFDPDANILTTRGNKFAVAFMENYVDFGIPEITLFVTTQQNESSFSIETLVPGLSGFTQLEPESEIYTRTGKAYKGQFTSIILQAGQIVGDPSIDISVQSNGDEDVFDRQKGFIINAENSKDELTVYALSANQASSDSFMALNCQYFPTRSYKYFIFAAPENAFELESQLLITPCEDRTRITVAPSQSLTHPLWVWSEFTNTNPATARRVETAYGRPLRLFETVRLSSTGDLTGTIITSTQPLSVFTGHQCGSLSFGGSCDYMIEQVPSHAVYGDMFLLAPFDVRQSGEVYRIGAVSDDIVVEINCDCQPRTLRGNRVGLTNFGRTHTAVLNRGEYIECETPKSVRKFCSVQASRPVTVMSYTHSHTVDRVGPLPNLPFNSIGDSSIVYVPPVLLYLSSEYTLTSLTPNYPLYFSYMTTDKKSSHTLIVNDNVFNSTRSNIECSICASNSVCGQGGFGYLGNGDFVISGQELFWGYAYGFGREVSYAFPLPFKQIPIGLPWVEARDVTVSESIGVVDLEFLITRGDNSDRTRVFALTVNSTAMEWEDFIPTGSSPNDEEAESNVRWRPGNTMPFRRFVVPIIDDNVPEATEVLEVWVECDNNQNCYLPRTKYTITILDDDDYCSDLAPVVNGSTTYDTINQPLNSTRPNGTVATVTCNTGYSLEGPSSLVCIVGEWTNDTVTCVEKKQCYDLSLLVNGALSYSLSASPNRPHGTVVDYTCNIGYVLNGTASPRCEDGVWSGNATCEPVQSILEVVAVAVTVVMVTVALVIVLAILLCCLTSRHSKANKLERKAFLTKRMKKLSVRSRLIDYQTSEVVKHVPESMRIPASNLKLQDTVGQGAFGIVYKGLLLDWANVPVRGVALKTLKGLFTLTDIQSMVSEITTMQEFDHPHVMSLIGVCLDAGPGVSIVMPFMANGSLLDYLKKQRSNLVMEDEQDSENVLAVRKLLLKMCHQVTLGMAYLAAHKFVHRDLAARNCMLDSNGDVRVGDFGLAEDTYTYGYYRQEDSDSVKLPYKWLAFESMTDALFNEKTDVWAYGVTMWEVFSGGHTPYPGMDPGSLVAMLKAGRRLEAPQNKACSAEIMSMMSSCWCEVPNDRPTFSELAKELESVLCSMVGYIELGMALTITPGDDHVYDDLPTLKERVKDIEAEREQVATETGTAFEREDEQTDGNTTKPLRNELEMSSGPVSTPSCNDSREQLHTVVIEYDTELRNPYTMIGESGYCSLQLNKQNSHETAI